MHLFGRLERYSRDARLFGDRRVRTVSLTEKGRRVFIPIFRQHAVHMKRAFQDVSSGERRQLEEVLERIARRADKLAEQEGRG